MAMKRLKKILLAILSLALLPILLQVAQLGGRHLIFI